MYCHCRAAHLAQARHARRLFEATQSEEQATAEAAHRQREVQRRMQPRSTEDFALLHAELEAWRLAETQRIKDAGLTPEQQQDQLQQLLHKVQHVLVYVLQLAMRAKSRAHMLVLLGTISNWRPLKLDLFMWSC